MTEHRNNQNPAGGFDITAWRNRRNNDLGRWAESCVEAGCQWYERTGRAVIHKTPEPMRVLRTAKQNSHCKANLTFSCVPAEKAQPDFQGTLSGGRSIVFEVKATTKQKLEKRAVTDTQASYLERHHKAGAAAYVCCYIESRFFMVPWHIWDNMKRIFGRQYVTGEDLQPYRVLCNGAVRFLDFAQDRKERYRMDDSNQRLPAGAEKTACTTVMQITGKDGDPKC